MADLDSMQQMPLFGLVDPIDIDYDPIRGLVYWVDRGSDTIPPYIGSVYLNGTGQATLQNGIGSKMLCVAK